MKNIIKHFILLFLLFILNIGAFAISYPLFQTSTRILEDAYFAFDSEDYGNALKFAEKAKIMRRNEATDCLEVINQALKPLAVQKAGDSITEILTVLTERDIFDAIELIEYIIDLKGKAFFHDSITEMLNYLEGKKIYPETSYIIAKIYELEGEYELANQYFTEAYSNASALDISDMKYDILYDKAILAFNFSNIEDCENSLLLIVKEDPYFSDLNYNYAIKNSIANKYSPDKVFELYRTDCYRSIPSFFKLTELYISQNRLEDAFSTALFGVLTSFTRMNEVIENRTSEYFFTGLENFFILAMDHSDISTWSIDNGFWRCFYRLGDLGCKLYPESKFGMEIFDVISKTAPEEYWRQISLSKIVKDN